MFVTGRPSIAWFNAHRGDSTTFQLQATGTEMDGIDDHYVC